MTRTSKMALSSLVAVAAAAISGAVGSPAYAKSGLGTARPTIQFMMKNGVKFTTNTMKEAKERLRQLAEAEAREHDLTHSGTGIVTRSTLPQWVIHRKPGFVINRQAAAAL